MAFALALLVLPWAAPQEGDEASSSFTPDQRLAAAYFYPAPEARLAPELQEMGKAAIDIALVDFKGDAPGLDPLVAALDLLEKEGKPRPRLGVFLQLGPTPDLSAADLFFGRVPPRHWARIDRRPIVWIGPAPAGSIQEPAAMAAAVSRLKQPPYLVAELSWKGASADRTYGSGSARGFALDLPVVSVGPGSSVRDDGKVYERNWYKAIKLEPRLVVIESWNGAADGVSETPERKRKYLDATHRYVRDFKVNEKIILSKGKWTGDNTVAYSIAYNPHERGLRPIAVEDGPFEELHLRGLEALSTRENKRTTVRRLCFDVDDSFWYFEKRSFEISVEFLDLGEGSFWLEYDSGDRTLPGEQRVVKSAGTVLFTNTGAWRTEGFKLPDAVFGNGQPGGSDFRLCTDKRGLAVRMIMVFKR